MRVLMTPKERDVAGVLMDPLDDRFGYVLPPVQEARWYRNGTTIFEEVVDRWCYREQTPEKIEASDRAE